VLFFESSRANQNVSVKNLMAARPTKGKVRGPNKGKKMIIYAELVRSSWGCVGSNGACQRGGIMTNGKVGGKEMCDIGFGEEAILGSKKLDRDCPGKIADGRAVRGRGENAATGKKPKPQTQKQRHKKKPNKRRPRGGGREGGGGAAEWGGSGGGRGGIGGRGSNGRGGGGFYTNPDRKE